MRRLWTVLVLMFWMAWTVSAQPADRSTTQTPIDKYAQVLVRYSLDLQPGETVLIVTGMEAHDLSSAVYREALLAGAHPLLIGIFPDQQEVFYRYAHESQLKYMSPVKRFMYEHFDACLFIDAPTNVRQLSGIAPERLSMAAASDRELFKIVMERVAKKELKTCYTTYPTNALAQEAEMGLIEYRSFVLDACKLDSPNPAEEWKRGAERQRQLAKWLTGKDKIVLKGSNIDLSMSVKGRSFIVADGKMNFPDGEIYCSPVENSANGWVRFRYPAIYEGREVKDVELWFEDGKVVKEEAAKGQEFLTEMLNTDEGARILGELGIGTNYGIKRFTKNMLYDEKIGSTIHLAVGIGFPESGGKNESSIHWDMLCDMSDGKITVDGELFYENGKFVKQQ